MVLFAAETTNPKQKHSGYVRDPHDWYVEPPFCTELLLDRVQFEKVWDPACGRGTIVETCHTRGIEAIGTDIVDRIHADSPLSVDFLSPTLAPPLDWTDIITNPPYRHAEAFVRRAFELDARRIAVLVRLDFLASQRRQVLFREYQPILVLVLSRRPSMPPGQALLNGTKPTSGQHDYCWIIWGPWLREPTTIEWAL